MALDLACNQVHAGHDAQLAITVLHQLGIAQHGPEPTLQTNLAVLAHLQQGSDLLKFQFILNTTTRVDQQHNCQRFGLLTSLIMKKIY